MSLNLLHMLVHTGAVLGSGFPSIGNLLQRGVLGQGNLRWVPRRRSLREVDGINRSHSPHLEAFPLGLLDHYSNRFLGVIKPNIIEPLLCLV